jgi:hypothetical protein
MGDASVRAAIVKFFTDAAITGIQDIYNDEPWFLDGGKWSLKDNGGWGSIAFVHLDTSSEKRLTMGGQNGAGTPTGEVDVLYTVSLVIQYQYLIPTSLPAGTREDAWVAPIDAIVDAVKTRIRSDPTFGTGAGGVIYQAGQGDGSGGPHIRQTRDLPVTDSQRSKVLNWNRIEFDARSIITA